MPCKHGKIAVKSDFGLRGYIEVRADEVVLKFGLPTLVKKHQAPRSRPYNIAIQ